MLLEAASPSTPVEELMVAYRVWLLGRGLAGPTVLRYENLARRFLLVRFEIAGDRFVEDVAGKHVVTFLLQELSLIHIYPLSPLEN